MFSWGKSVLYRATPNLHRMKRQRAGMLLCVDRRSGIGFGVIEAQIRNRIQLLTPVPACAECATAGRG